MTAAQPAQRGTVDPVMRVSQALTGSTTGSVSALRLWHHGRGDSAGANLPHTARTNAMKRYESIAQTANTHGRAKIVVE